MFPTIKAVAKETPTPTKTSIRPFTPIKYGAATGEPVSGDLPKDHFIHALIFRVNLGTLTGGATGDWNTDAKEKIIKSLVVRAEGTKYFKQGQWNEFKQICISNLEKQPDGSVKIYFDDPKIEEAMPLPSWLFTSLVCQLDFEAITNLQTGDRTDQTGTEVKITVVESHFNKEDMSYWPVLIEAVRTKQTFGTNTGYQVYEHERANVISSMLIHADDAGVESDTIFDKIRLIGRTKKAHYPIYDDVSLIDIKNANKESYQQQALATGFFMVEWPKGLNTSSFTSLKTELNIPTAGSNAGVRIMERYLL